MPHHPHPAPANDPLMPAPPFTAAEWRRIAASLGLTPQQSRVAELILRGKPDKQIAAEMAISVPTVRTHICRMFATLGIAGRTELAQHILAAHRRLTGSG